MTVTAPNGGENYSAHSTQTVTWTATDASGIAYVDIYLSRITGRRTSRCSGSSTHDGTQDLFIPNFPGAQTYVRVGAMDNAGNYGWDNSNTSFTIIGAPAGKVPTTLRDVELAGSQPLTVTQFEHPDESCVTCHGEYDAAVEPYHNWKGSMMAQAKRDPLFLACRRDRRAGRALGGRSVPALPHAGRLAGRSLVRHGRRHGHGEGPRGRPVRLLSPPGRPDLSAGCEPAG